MPRINGFSKWTIDSLIHFSLPENEVLFSPPPPFISRMMSHINVTRNFIHVFVCVTICVSLSNSGDGIAGMRFRPRVIPHVACDWKDTSYITVHPFLRNPRIQYASGRPQPLLIFHVSLALLLLFQ